MKGVAIIGSLLMVFLLVCAEPDGDYTNKYDNIDLDAILQNKRLLSNYVNCLLGTGNCSPDATELKKVLPDALKTGCEKCTDKQRNGSRKVIRHMMEHEPESWDKLKKIYDPTGEYSEKYKE